MQTQGHDKSCTDDDVPVQEKAGTVAFSDDEGNIAEDDVHTAVAGCGRRGQVKRSRYPLLFQRSCRDHLDELRANGQKGAVMETPELMPHKYGTSHYNLVR